MTFLSEVARNLNDTLAGDPQRRAALRSARRRLLSASGLTDNERHLLGPEPAALTDDERHLLRRVSIRVHASDDMFRIANPAHYLLAGLSGVRCIHQALAACDRTGRLASVLDFPCGYGRVLRYLKLEFPQAKITACDINPEALSFCMRVFNVDGVVSRGDVDAVVLPERYDLIWCGSLITHIHEHAASGLLRLFCNHLTPQGVCVFSAHGQRTVDWIRHGQEGFGLTEEGRGLLLREFDARGFGYADYPGQAGYGISVVSHNRMAAMAMTAGEWREALYLQHAWGNHHDIYAFAKGM